MKVKCSNCGEKYDDVKDAKKHKKCKPKMVIEDKKPKKNISIKWMKSYDFKPKEEYIKVIEDVKESLKEDDYTEEDIIDFLCEEVWYLRRHIDEQDMIIMELEKKLERFKTFK